MSLWVDKYRPNSLQKLDYHKSQAAHLKNLVSLAHFLALKMKENPCLP